MPARHNLAWAAGPCQFHEASSNDGQAESTTAIMKQAHARISDTSCNAR
jgi:hypothetical protein